MSGDMSFNDLPDQLINELREHVSHLHDRTSEADELLRQSHAVNGKVVIMKEYKDEVNAFNACFHGKDRSGLVQSLQHENRQILALQQENRELKEALEDMKRGMTLMMEKHREVVKGFNRSNSLLTLIAKHYESGKSEREYERRFFELADLYMETLSKLESQHCSDIEKMTAVCAENRYLRKSLASRGAIVPGINCDANGRPIDMLAIEARACQKALKQAEMVEVQECVVETRPPVRKVSSEAPKMSVLEARRNQKFLNGESDRKESALQSKTDQTNTNGDNRDNHTGRATEM